MHFKNTISSSGLIFIPVRSYNTPEIFSLFFKFLARIFNLCLNKYL